MCKRLLSVIAFAAALVLALLEGSAFARDLTREELAITGLYVRCPKDEATSCSQIKETVQKLYSSDSSISHRDWRSQMQKFEILNLLPETVNGNPWAILDLPSRMRSIELLWSVKNDTLTVSLQSPRDATAFRLWSMKGGVRTVSGAELKNTWSFQFKESMLSGPEGLFIRVFTASELED